MYKQKILLQTSISFVAGKHISVMYCLRFHFIIITTAIKRQGRHTHKIRVISGLIHVYFLTFARFLNGKCLSLIHIQMCIRDSTIGYTAEYCSSALLLVSPYKLQDYSIMVIPMSQFMLITEYNSYEGDGSPNFSRTLNRLFCE